MATKRYFSQNSLGGTAFRALSTSPTYDVSMADIWFEQSYEDFVGAGRSAYLTLGVQPFISTEQFSSSTKPDGTTTPATVSSNSATAIGHGPLYGTYPADGWTASVAVRCDNIASGYQLHANLRVWYAATADAADAVLLTNSNIVLSTVSTNGGGVATTGTFSLDADLETDGGYIFFQFAYVVDTVPGVWDVYDVQIQSIDDYGTLASYIEFPEPTNMPGTVVGTITAAATAVADSAALTSAAGSAAGTSTSHARPPINWGTGAGVARGTSVARGAIYTVWKNASGRAAAAATMTGVGAFNRNARATSHGAAACSAVGARTILRPAVGASTARGESTAVSAATADTTASTAGASAAVAHAAVVLQATGASSGSAACHGAPTTTAAIVASAMGASIALGAGASSRVFVDKTAVDYRWAAARSAPTVVGVCTDCAPHNTATALPIMAASTVGSVPHTNTPRPQPVASSVTDEYNSIRVIRPSSPEWVVTEPEAPPSAGSPHTDQTRISV